MAGEKQKLIPVIKTIIDDANTPVTAFLKLNAKNSFLLESVTGGQHVARYSFIGLDPIEELRMENNMATASDPVTLLQERFNHYSLDTLPEQLPPFIGGPVGYFSWETVQFIEPNLCIKEKSKAPYPLMHFLFPGSILAFDHAKRSISIIVLAKEGEEGEAEAKISDISAKLQEPIAVPPIPEPKTVNDLDEIFSTVSSSTTKAQFMADIESAKHYIREGDSFQLVLSQQFSVPSEKSPFDVYRTLRSVNPSPYMFYFNFNDYQVVGSSPEILTKLEGDTAALRPIAGTRPRIEGQEQALIMDLLQDEKEIAEHIMLVDLGRNDLGRVCDYDSVTTSDLLTVEQYSHVMHIVSHIEGKLKKEKNAFDLFRATYPAGTLSGAPKVRAMEIIEELEPIKRGPYGGALGYFDFRGNMDLCIVIRTLFSTDTGYMIQAGAGIVADSDPETEFDESRNKAKGMVQACL